MCCANQKTLYDVKYLRILTHLHATPFKKSVFCEIIIIPFSESTFKAKVMLARKKRKKRNSDAGVFLWILQNF